MRRLFRIFLVVLSVASLAIAVVAATAIAFNLNLGSWPDGPVQGIRPTLMLTRNILLLGVITPVPDGVQINGRSADYWGGLQLTDSMVASGPLLTTPTFIGRMRSARIPTWWLAVGGLLPPTAWLWSARRARRRRQQTPHACPACGYDCRASPERCPECGRAVAAT